VSAAARVAVAYSGGRDSTALLHATVEAARGAGVQVVALHVHHGLNPQADAWLALCREVCARWAAGGAPLSFVAERLAGRPGPGDSLEAWARDGRYRALTRMAHAAGASVVLLAHHRRDQAETWLLQALRGAGTAGLAAMPREIRRDGLLWIRPWLDRPRSALEAYGVAHGLVYVDDDSNDDERLARNRLRRRVWPALEAAFPQAEACLADAAAWAAQADAALDELAALDLEHIAPGTELDVAAWRGLSDARRSNAMRAWLRARLGQPAPASLVQRLLVQLEAGRARRWPAGAGELRSHRGRLHWVPRREPPRAGAAERESRLCITRAGAYRLPGWGGRLQVTRVAFGGVPLAWLAHAELRPRQGAEQFQAGLGRPPRSLKKQFQAAGVAAWQRDGPLLYSGGQLVFVPGLGLDARIVGLPGQPLVTLEWLPIGDTEAAGARARRGRRRGES